MFHIRVFSRDMSCYFPNKVRVIQLHAVYDAWAIEVSRRVPTCHAALELCAKTLHDAVRTHDKGMLQHGFGMILTRMPVTFWLLLGRAENMDLVTPIGKEKQ